MFGISKREIANKIAEKIIKDLRERGYIHLPHVGTLRHTAGSGEVRFESDPGLLEELEEKV